MTMIAIAPAEIDGRTAYRLMSGAVTPRPIAWTTTLNADGSVNLAPFSSFVFLTYDPPKLGISIGPGTERLKDTLANIKRTGEFVVNSVSESQISAVAELSRDYAPGISEAADLGIAVEPSAAIAVPRVKLSEIALECVLDRIVDLDDRDAHRLVIGRVVTFQIASRVLRGDRIDPHLFRPVGRLGGPNYLVDSSVRRHEPTAKPPVR